MVVHLESQVVMQTKLLLIRYHRLPITIFMGPIYYQKIKHLGRPRAGFEWKIPRKVERSWLVFYESVWGSRRMCEGKSIYTRTSIRVS
ncbi:uncharacterized protein LOC111498549 isoform X2 [Cucurbita maxima]|uniref:Uncharacterized protein LOC111498549 isoform X2 n=1 Tax=Cucurbita maxima TaxID=3661 RepID=A0A6J1KXV8_CUCMA|nr:uncharacterized protein LOC111498549 isoform X2 [Cucurbita maxima]